MHVDGLLATGNSDVDVSLLITCAEVPLGLVVFLADRHQAVGTIFKRKGARIQIGIFVAFRITDRSRVAIDEREGLIGVKHSPTNGTAIAASRTVEDFGLDPLRRISSQFSTRTSSVTVPSCFGWMPMTALRPPVKPAGGQV